MPSNRFEARPIATLVGTVLVVLLLLAAVAEGILANTSKPYGRQLAESYRKRHAVLRELVPNRDMSVTSSQKLVHHKDGRPDKHYSVRTDAHGFLKPSDVHQNPDLRIVFLGGSTTECMFVDEDLRFPTLTGRLLEQSLGIAVNSYNGGVSGNNSMHSNTILLTKVLPMAPDMVVMMHNINDLSTLSILGSYWPDGGSRAMLEWEKPEQGGRWKEFKRTLQGVKNVTFPNLWAWLDLRKRLVALLRLPPPAVDEFQRQRTGSLQLDEGHIRRAFKNSLTTFIRITRTWGGKPVLMTQAYYGGIHELADPKLQDGGIRWGWDEELEAYLALHTILNDDIRLLAQEEGVLLIDLAKSIPLDMEHLYDGVHLSETGSRAAAQVISRALEGALNQNTR